MTPCYWSSIKRFYIKEFFLKKILKHFFNRLHIHLLGDSCTARNSRNEQINTFTNLADEKGMIHL